MNVLKPIITITLLLISILPVKAGILGFKKDQLVLRAGINTSGTKVFTGENSTMFPGAGVNTHFGYHFGKWEMTLSSYSIFGKLRSIEFAFDDQHISGSGTLSSVMFGPIVKYYTKFSYNPKYSFYLSVGPVWSIESIKLDTPPEGEDEDEWESNHKLTYTSRGLFASMGLHDRVKKKNEYPIFYEISYSYQKAYKVAFIDITDRAKVKTISQQQTKQHVTAHTFFFAIGFTIF